MSLVGEKVSHLLVIFITVSKKRALLVTLPLRNVGGYYSS